MNTTVIITIAAALILVIYYVTTYNYFKSQKQEIEKQRSGIEIALTNRYDTLVKLNQAVNGYTGHESSVLTGVTQIRKGMNVDELSEAEGKIGEAFSGLCALVESYPELKASANFLQLQETVNDLENTLQATRRIYNNEVSEYNSKIERIPSCFIAKISGAKSEKYFEIEEHKRNDVALAF